MRILDRYTLRAYLAPLIWCLGIFIGLYLILDLLGHLDEILRNKIPFPILLIYYGTSIPLIFVQIAPFACLMATLYTVGNLNRHQELMAMRASGIPPFRIVRPLIWVGILMSAAVLVVNEVVAPDAALMSRAIKENYLERQTDSPNSKKIIKTVEHMAAYGQGHTLLYADLFDPVQKKMEGVIILQHWPNLGLRRKVTAASAVWTGSQWRFFNGTILQFNEKGQSVGRPVPFTSKILQVGDRPEILAKSKSQSDFMNMQDLSRYIRRLKIVGGGTVRKLWVDLFAKPASAFACLVLTLIGIPFAIQPVRGGTALGLSFGLAVGLGFYGTNALMIALGKGGVFPPIIATWGTHLLFTTFGIQQTWRRLA